jgi:nitronate monooxygenase
MGPESDTSDSSRRAFVRRAALLGASVAALGGASASHTPTAESQPGPALPEHAGASAFMNLLGLRYPISQAPLSGPGGPELAIAVAEAGALGALALTPESPDGAERVVQRVRADTGGAFVVNYVLRSEPVSLARAVNAGAPAVQFSWGMPTPEHIRQIRAAGARVGIQVTGAGSARRALDLGTDYLVCQGVAAGGHVQGTRPLTTILDEVLAEVGQRRQGVPVLASGGIATGAAMRIVMNRGAAGAVLGTRFVATTESRAHPDYKRALVDTRDGAGTILTTCLNKGWPNAPHRILLANPTFQMWDAGCPPEGMRPGERDVVGHTADGAPIERYRLNTPIVGMTGAVLELGTFAGAGVGDVRDVPSAGDLVRRLWQEYEQTIG